MIHPFDTRSMKPPAPSQHIFARTPTTIPARPLGSWAALDVGPEEVKTSDTGEGVIGGFSTLNAALATVYTNHKESDAIRNKLKNLHLHIAALGALFATPPGNVAEQGRRSELIRKLGGIEGLLRSSYGAPGLQRLGSPVHDDRDIFRLLEELREAIFHYQIKREKMIHEQTCRLIDPAEAAILNNFRCAQAVEYRHGERNGCMKGTRGAVLDEIELWTKDFDRPPIYWLNGLAGTGKSTIAQTIAERTFASGQLGASFFCSRDFLDRSNLQFIFPTLAIQLARKFPEFRSILIPLVQSDPGIIYESLSCQMERLIVQPLTESGISTVIIIDALDECRDHKPTSAILSVLGQLVSEIPKVKIFLTGRPERRIREGFGLPQMMEATHVLVLHDVEPHQVESDIQLFFEHSLSEVATRLHGPKDWPTKEQLDLLCERAAGLFVYAVATVKFIDHGNNGPGEQLDRLLKFESSAREGRIELKEGMSLDSLYMSILREAFSHDDPEDDHRIRSVLGAVTLAANPLSPSTIATLLRLPTEGVHLRLLSVHSLLILREDVNHPVQPFHKSFPDFIIDPTRCIDQRFRVSPPNHHSELLIGCLDLMNRRLEKNVCKLSDGVVNSEVDDLRERVEQYIGHGLRYACESWHKHLVNPRTVPAHAPKITSVLRQFLEEKGLFWLEVLSVLGTLRDAVDALDAAAKWLEGSPTLELVKDYFRFVTGFFEVISTSAPHIYHSALSLSPQTSIVRRLYERYARPLMRIVRGVPMSWDPSIASIKCSDSIHCIAWSPCSRFIAISFLYGMEIHLLDAATLKRLKSFTSPPPHHHIDLLTFSPETRSLMWFSDRSKAFTSRDLQTGVRVGEILTEESPLRPLSITHSGCGTMLGVLFKGGSDTPTINTYNILSGTLIYRHPIKGTSTGTIWRHGDCVRFTTAVSGFITVWEIGFSSELPPTEVESFLTPNDFQISSQFLFHPTPPRLASIIDPERTVLVWDARYSKPLLNSVDVERPDKISFSTDGHFFACEGGGQGIYIWKESPTGYTLYRKLVLNSTGMKDPTQTFSPNGQSIVTAGEQDLQLWRTTDSSSSTSSILAGDFRGTDQTKPFIVGFSPDGLLAVTGRLWDDTAIVFDLKSGATRLTVDTGTAIYALGVTGSALAVVGSGKVITWNLPTGVHGLSARAASNDNILTTRLDRWEPSPPNESESVSISPSLNYVAISRWFWFAGSGSVTIHDICDASTGIHLERVQSQGRNPSWFTPDGREFWSFGGLDRTSTSQHSKKNIGWKIIRNTESNVTKLERLDPTVGPSGGLPRESSHGCQVMDGGWVLSSTGKRLLWLPPRWRSEEIHRMWSGRFLALLHGGLPEAVVLELLAE